ncbi:DNA repair protein XRCC3 [Acipenser oxyrinchus oxyrinchus]|uniref:DNA repair protein XRCC3 n=1 Tax=Acipenser oxyrinchus oxyrinchus TaxID=40147 RepID=A0AAD8FNG2_ACIOX|nr:DNA repair protein XRCC3 [Acipenser oxyrinchus oxyrinchus]
MDWGQVELNPKVVHAVKRANVKTFREVLSLSGPDLQRLTKLSHADVHHLQKTVAAAVQTDRAVTALQLYRGECPSRTAPETESGLPCHGLSAEGGIPCRVS